MSTWKMISNDILNYSSLGDDVVAFTTKRTLGRDRTRMCQMLGIDDNRLIMPHQTHQDNVLQIDNTLLTLHPEEQKAKLEGIDAVYTSMAGVCIGVSTADCIPVILYDSVTRSAAAIHAGWKGTVQRIVEKTIMQMQQTLGVKAENLRAVIGPGISQEHFEVGDEVYDAFALQGFDMPRIAIRKDKWHIDLWECNRLQLVHSGLIAENIHVEDICTYSNTDMFFSARKEQTDTVNKCGRNFNAIIIK